MMVMAVIDATARDLVPGFAVRLWNVEPGIIVPGKLLGSGLSDVEAARELVPPGLVNIGTMPGDDPAICEVWV